MKDKNDSSVSSVSLNQIKKMKKKEAPSNVDANIFVAHELKFIKRLAGNDPQLSEKQLKMIVNWFQLSNSSSKHFSDHINNLWRCLFFAMWLSDKPLAQEKLAESLASLLHVFDEKDDSILFYGAFVKVLGKEWSGIEECRIDKFMMLLQRMTRQMFVVLHDNEWDKNLIKQLNKCLEKRIQDKSMSDGFPMHFTETFLGELTQVSVDKISRSEVTLLTKLFATCVGTQRGPTVKRMFDDLIYQTELGRAYVEKYTPWIDVGSLGELKAGPDQNTNDDKASETVQRYDEDKESRLSYALDPRVVIVPEIPFGTEETPSSDDNEQELVDFETEKQQPSTGIEKLNKKKRAKVSNDIEVQSSKKVRLCKVEDSKLNKKKQMEQWVVTDLTPEEIAVDASNTCPDQSMTSDVDLNQSTTAVDPNMENVVNSTTRPFSVTDDEWRTPPVEGEAKHSESRLQNRISDANKKQSNLNGIPSKQFSSSGTDKKHERNTTAPMPSTSNGSFVPSTSGSVKKSVNIMLQLNCSQDHDDYIQKLISSPQVPYDSAKGPGKGLLKPNSVPGPIRLPHKRKIGFNFKRFDFLR